MKRIFVLFIFYFSLNICFLSAQTSRFESDNNKYFFDIGLSYSTMIFEGDGTMVNLHGAYYFAPNLGIRTGLSYTSNITDDCDWMIKIPALFSFRTETIESMEPNFDDDETLGEMLFSSLLYILPKRFEINAGPSFGYMSPYNLPNKHGQLVEDFYYINTKTMATLDLNGKMTIPINRVGVDLSLGVSYFLTKNIKSVSPNGVDSKTHRWIGNFSVGIHYRF